MQDYIHLIFKIRTVYYPGVGATVVYGGSYGSIIASSMRLKFPSIVQGSIASSGPVGNYRRPGRLGGLHRADYPPRVSWHHAGIFPGHGPNRTGVALPGLALPGDRPDSPLDQFPGGGSGEP